MRWRWGLSFAVAACLLAAVQARAFRPPGKNTEWEIPRLGAPSQQVWETYAVTGPGGRPAAPLEAFSRQYGGDWFYQVNKLTGTFHHVYGSGVQTGSALSSSKEAEASARAVLVAEAD